MECEMSVSLMMIICTRVHDTVIFVTVNAIRHLIDVNGFASRKYLDIWNISIWIYLEGKKWIKTLTLSGSITIHSPMSKSSSSLEL